MAKLFFTFGEMDSMKTAFMLMAKHNYEQGGSRVLVAKPAADTRADRGIYSRAVQGCEADFLITPGMNVRREVRRIIGLGGEAVKAVLVDEVQFATKRQVLQMAKLAVLDGIPVLTFGLRADFMGELFEGSEAAFALAHEVRQTITMCGHGSGCDHKAVLNARQQNGLYVREGPQVEIDGAVAGDVVTTYRSLCIKHYLDEVGQLYGDDDDDLEGL